MYQDKEAVGPGGAAEPPAPEDARPLPSVPFLLSTHHRLERWSKARQQSHEQAEYIASLNQGWHAGELSRLRQCGKQIHFRYENNNPSHVHAAYFCQLPKLCTLCAIRRASRLTERYETRLAVCNREHPGLWAYDLTLTVKNGPNLAERLDHIRQALRAELVAAREWNKGQRRRSRPAFHPFVGGVYTLEITRRETGWHPHIHGIYLADAWPCVDTIRAAWLKRTGDSHVFRLNSLGKLGEALETPSKSDTRQTTKSRGALMEVFKYTISPDREMTPADRLAVAEVLRKAKAAQPWGVLRGLPDDEDLDDDAPELDSPDALDFYAYWCEARKRYELGRMRDAD